MYRIRIKKAPGGQAAMGNGQAAMGGRESAMGNGQWAMGGSPGARKLRMGDQAGHGLFVGGGQPSAVGRQPSAGIGVRSFVPEVPREVANIEAERGETVMGDFDQDGAPEHLRVGGARHAQGGTPLQVPEDSFIFSDTRKLKIGGPVLQEFGKSANTKKKYTPAELAKQYELNRYKEVLSDPFSDPMERKTAALMLQNNQQKLAKLALLQEGMKGFPQGIPSMALPLLQGMAGDGRRESAMGNGQSAIGSRELASYQPSASSYQQEDDGYQQAMGQESGARSQMGNGEWAMGNEQEGQMGAPGGGPSPGAQDDSFPAGLPMAQDGHWVQPHGPSPFSWNLPVVPVQPQAASSFVGSQPFWNLPADRRSYYIQQQTAPTASQLPPLPSGQRPWDMASPRSYYIQQQTAPASGPLPPLPSGQRPWDLVGRPSYYVQQPSAPDMSQLPPLSGGQLPWDPYAQPQQGFSFRDRPGGSGMAPSSVGSTQSAGRSGASAGSNSQSGAPSDIPAWFRLWTKSNTPDGARSPKGKSTVYDPSRGNAIYDDYRYWSSVAGRPFTDAKDYQSFVYNQVKKSDWGSLYKMWDEYGLTRAANANPTDPDWGFADGYFGARTADVSHWRPKPDVPAGTTPDVPKDEPPTKTETKQDKPASYPKPGDPTWQGRRGEWTPWWTQDKVNLLAAYKNRYGLNKYMPTYVSPDLVLPNAVYYDPTRAVAGTQEAAALQHMMNMTYAGPQRLRAVGSNVQGQGFGQVAGTLGDYANRNVAVGNQFANIRAGMQNQHSQGVAGLKDQYLKGNTIANQQYDNAVRMMDNDVRRNFVSGMTNAQKLGWMNALNPYYSLNPDAFAPTNRQLFFKQGKALSAPATGSQLGSDPVSLYNSYVQQYMDKVQGADRKSAQEFALRAALANKSQYGVEGDGDARMSMSGLGYNPGMMAYLQGSMPQF